MQITPESSNLEDYLKESEIINYSHPLISKTVKVLFNNEQSEIEKVKVAYEFVRDQVSHSWDIQSNKVTCKASDILKYKEGICYAKSNLLAALLRAINIPTGFCYQRLMLFDSPEGGYSLHALNGVYLKTLNRWVRLDARGNKQGVQAEFSVHEEKLAFNIREDLDEIDYPIIYTSPNEKTIATLDTNKNALIMYTHNLPDRL
nr:transglutaminase family protein [Paenibacillus bovis]